MNSLPGSAASTGARRRPRHPPLVRALELRRRPSGPSPSTHLAESVSGLHSPMRVTSVTSSHTCSAGAATSTLDLPHIDQSSLLLAVVATQHGGCRRVGQRIAAACERSGRTADDVLLVGVTKYATWAQTGETPRRRRHPTSARTTPSSCGTGPRTPASLAPGGTPSGRCRRTRPATSPGGPRRSTPSTGSRSPRRSRPGGEGDPLDCYVQVNVAGEPTKAGVAPGEVGAAGAGCRVCRASEVVGLMAMPPLAADPEDSRPWFRALRAAGRGARARAACRWARRPTSRSRSRRGATVVRVGAALSDLSRRSWVDEPRPRTVVSMAPDDTDDELSHLDERIATQFAADSAGGRPSATRRRERRRATGAAERVAAGQPARRPRRAHRPDGAPPQRARRGRCSSPSTRRCPSSATG